MRILSHEQGARWADVWERQSDGSTAGTAAAPHARSFLLDPDSGRKTELFRLIATGVAEFKGTGVLWIGEIGIWPSGENLELFNGYRRSLGETRPLHEAPIHEFGSGDYIPLECLGVRRPGPEGASLRGFWQAIQAAGRETLPRRPPRTSEPRKSAGRRPA